LNHVTALTTSTETIQLSSRRAQIHEARRRNVAENHSTELRKSRAACASDKSCIGHFHIQRGAAELLFLSRVRVIIQTLYYHHLSGIPGIP
jgi:hypothetical protein